MLNAFTRPAWFPVCCGQCVDATAKGISAPPNRAPRVKKIPRQKQSNEVDHQLKRHPFDQHW